MPPNPESRAFVERFTRLTGHEPQSTDAMNHDALLLVARAAREVGPKRSAIRDYLRALGRTQPPYRGVVGAIAFTPDRPLLLHVARLRGRRAVRVGSP